VYLHPTRKILAVRYEKITESICLWSIYTFFSIFNYLGNRIQWIGFYCYCDLEVNDFKIAKGGGFGN